MSLALCNLAVLAALATGDGAWVETECFPACRAGYVCEGGACVATEPAGECVPDCRAGFRCEGGQCVAAEPATGMCVPACRDGHRCEGGRCVAARARRPVKPREPRGPPRFELSLLYTWGTIALSDTPDSDALAPGAVRFGGREINVVAQGQLRRGDSDHWFAVDAGWTVVRRREEGRSNHNTNGVVLGGSYVVRIPLHRPSYDLMVDHRVSVDVAAGAYLMSADGLDVGPQAQVRLSVYWFGAGVLATYGAARGGLGVGLGTTARVSF